MLGHREPQRSYFIPSYFGGEKIAEDSFYSLLATIGDQMFTDEEFRELYCRDNGRPSIPPSIMGKVLLLQNYTGASDREAAECVRYDLRWLHALGVPFEYEGFHPSLLPRFRKRLREKGWERMAFDKTVQAARELGLLPDDPTMLVDSTWVKGAGRVQDTYTLLRTALRKVLEALGYRPLNRRRKLKGRLAGYLKPGKPEINWADAQARQQHLEELCEDAHEVLALARASKAEGADGGEAEILAGLLGEPAQAKQDESDDPPEDDARQKAEERQQVEQAAGLLEKIMADDVTENEEGEPVLRQGVAKDRIVSVTDPEMRHGRKSASHRFDGYKVEFYEAEAEDEKIENIITDVTALPGNARDGQTTPERLDYQKEQFGIRPSKLIGDGQYGNADRRAELAERGIEILSPVQGSGRNGRFGKEEFQVDLEAGRVTCPAGQTTTSFQWLKDRQERRVKQFRFGAAVCAACPLREQCTTNTKLGRSITLHYHEEHLQRARQQQKEPGFTERYNRRSAVERTVAHAVRCGLRQARYRGREGVEFQALWVGAVINLRRLRRCRQGLQALGSALSAGASVRLASVPP